MEAVKFDRRRQLPGETFDSFVTDLKLLAWGLDITETEILIRNAIACKSLDERVRQRCLEKSKHLSLDSAIDIGRMFEATKDGMEVMAGEDPRVAVNTVTSKPGSPRRRINQKKYKQPGKCGYRAHKPQEKCPAKNEPCNKCSKLGHFAQVCRSQESRVNSLDEEIYPSDDEEDANVHLLHIASLEMNSVTDKSHCGDEDEWWETLQVGNSTLRCQLDTGAHANVINISQLQQVAPNAQIKKTQQILVSFSQHRMTPRGYTTLPVRFKDRESWVKFYVINSKQNPILSGKARQALNLVQRVHQLDTDLKELLDRHPDLENTSGAMPGTYSTWPPEITAALLPKIVDKLKEMEKEGHLAKVMQPTDWVNSMVVSRRGEKIRICLDLADLNKAVKREHYPIPTVEEIVGNLYSP